MAQSALSSPAAERGEVTRLLARWTAGDAAAGDAVFPLIYDELRRLAARYLRRERPDHTLPPTALVHEAYLRLMGSDPRHATIENRVHFFAVAAKAMRRILVEHARRLAAARRPPAKLRTAFEEDGTGDRSEAPHLEVLAVHEAIERLRGDHPRAMRIVELRFFGGLSEGEVGEALDLSRSTVARDWRLAKLLLARRLRRGGKK